MIPLKDRITMWLDRHLELAWNCYVKDEHHVKMDSHGKCYRCGRRILGSGESSNHTYVNGPKRYHTKAEQDAGYPPVTQPPERPTK